MTAVITDSMYSFRLWCKTRGFKRIFNTREYVDNENEIYTPIWRVDQTEGVIFTNYELVNPCLEKETKLIDAVRLRIRK